MILVWGVFAVLSGLVQNYTQLLLVRFVLGIADGGIWLAILVLTRDADRDQPFGASYSARSARTG
jgi:MFS family permease